MMMFYYAIARATAPWQALLYVNSDPPRGMFSYSKSTPNGSIAVTDRTRRKLVSRMIKSHLQHQNTYLLTLPMAVKKSIFKLVMGDCFFGGLAIAYRGFYSPETKLTRIEL